MSEEEVMSKQENKTVRIITAYNDVPYFIIENDLKELGQEDYISEVSEIKDLYEYYEKGMDFNTEGTNGEYIPSDIRFKKASSILRKEARFLFSNPPTFNVNIDDVDKEFVEENTILQDYLDKVLVKNNFNGQLIKAVKDCFIGKRVAIILNFNDINQEISLMFLNSLEFLFKLSDSNPNKLEKFICFHNTVNSSNKLEQKWFKKVYTLKSDGFVYVDEHYYDGLGNLLEDMPSLEDMKTELTNIPAVVILNDGLIGDTKGESELAGLLDYEGTYSKLSNEDIDIERKGMNPTFYTIDATQTSTENLSRAPGSFWDLQTDYEGPSDNPPQAKAGILEPNMNYSNSLKTTLDRIENEMYAEVDVPNINSEKLMGVITSGKTISALYWGLVVRCDEKMLVWGPQFEYIAKMIIEGGKLYPTCIVKYTEETLPDIEYDILVENNYPLPEDVAEEKNLDITEVDAKLMSKKSYLKKWRNLTDKEADDEIRQIKLESDLFDNSMANLSEFNLNDSGDYERYSGNDDNEDQESQEDKDQNEGNEDINKQ